MTTEMYEYVDRSVAAERAGDASVALEWHQSVPMFRKSRHRAVLEQIASLGEELPEWVWARWIVYQALRCEDGGTGDLVREAMEEVVHSIHGDLLHDCYVRGGDPVLVAARVAGESWAYQQAAAYEYDVVHRFIEEFATGALAEHADLAREWVDVPLSGYELGESIPGGRLLVRDAGAEEWSEALDIGARSVADSEAGTWVWGRLVPSGVDGLPMFDMTPLAVVADTAIMLTDPPYADAWIDLLADGSDRKVSTSANLLHEDYELCSDVRELDLLAFGTPAADRPRVFQQLREGRDEVSRAAFRILRKARDGEIDVSDQAYVGAAVMNVRARHDAVDKLVRPGQPAPWLDWAGLVNEPARGLLLDLAQAAQAAA